MKTLMAEHFGHHVLTNDSLNYCNYYYKTPKHFPASSHPAVVIKRFSVSMIIWIWKSSLVDENQKPHTFYPCLEGPSDSVCYCKHIITKKSTNIAGQVFYLLQHRTFTPRI